MDCATHSNPATAALVADHLDFFKHHAPFDRMEPEALNFLAERVSLVFYPQNAEIVGPSSGVPKELTIVQRGKVIARQVGEVSVTEYSALDLGPGECFPIGALTAQRPSTNSYYATEDTTCYLLNADDFLQLMRISNVFQLFCMQYIADLLSQSREQLKTQMGQRAAEQQSMTTPLSQLAKKTPISVTPATPVRQALELMSESKVGCMVIADEYGHPEGVLTQSDVLRRIALVSFPLERPISEVMSPNPHVMRATDSAYDAALVMATQGVRHILIIDNEGRLTGVISERDLFALQRIGLRQIRASIESARDIDSLRQASEDIRQLALNLLAQGIGAEQLTHFIAALNDALTRRIIEIQLDQHDLHGVEYAWLAFGSEGRHEQTLSTDQDNGIIYLCPEWQDKEELKLRLLAFAHDVNQALARCGFPLCEGNIMASNPELTLTLEEWKDRFSHWLREADPQSLLNGTIFFDFRGLYGSHSLENQLRSWLLQMTGSNPLFLKMMASNAIQVSPPLGKIRDFVIEDDADHPGTIDLKKFGARLFVDAARILAMRTGVEATSTVQRLRQSAAKLGMPAEEIDAMLEGFHFIQLLRLRNQHGNLAHSAGDNRVNPDHLNTLDRQILKETFRQARKLQLRLKLDYQL